MANHSERDDAVSPSLPPVTAPAPPSRPKRGRPTLFTEEVARKVCGSIRQHGWSETRAALLNGIHPGNIGPWKKAHPDFALAIESARTECLARQLETLSEFENKSGSKSWRAQAWLIERTFPEEYGRWRPHKSDPAPAPSPVVDIDHLLQFRQEDLTEYQRRRAVWLKNLRDSAAEHRAEVAQNLASTSEAAAEKSDFSDTIIHKSPPPPSTAMDTNPNWM